MAFRIVDRRFRRHRGVPKYALRIGLIGIIFLLVAAAPAAAQVGGTSCADCDATELIRRLGLREAAQPVRDRPGWSPPRTIVVRGGESMIEWLQPAAPGVTLVAVPDLQSAVLALGEADAILGYCSPSILEAGIRLQWIQLWSAGVEGCLSVPAIRERNLLLTNAQRLYAPEVAEHALAMTLVFARGLHRFMADPGGGSWKPSVVPRAQQWELDGKTMLVAGLGGIGTEVARRAHALGMRVVATRRSRREGPGFVDYVGFPDELIGLASEADVVVNTLPLTPETTGVFDARFFAGMKPSAYFINVARGKSVVTDDLVDAIRSNSIAGAALDVTDPEPLPPGHPLWEFPDVIITPHTASGSDLASHRLRLLLRENLRRFVAGEPMLSVVDPASGY